MNVNDDMIARYFNGNTTQEEKKLVRTYLCNNPSKLETILHLMDDDVDYLCEQDIANNLCMSSKDTFIDNNICCGDITINYKNNALKDSSDDFLDRLRNLSKEINL